MVHSDYLYIKSLREEYQGYSEPFIETSEQESSQKPSLYGDKTADPQKRPSIEETVDFLEKKAPTNLTERWI